jgi:hypothetical protein
VSSRGTNLRLHPHTYNGADKLSSQSSRKRSADDRPERHPPTTKRVKSALGLHSRKDGTNSADSLHKDATTEDDLLEALETVGDESESPSGMSTWKLPLDQDVSNGGSMSIAGVTENEPCDDAPTSVIDATADVAEPDFDEDTDFAQYEVIPGTDDETRSEDSEAARRNLSTVLETTALSESSSSRNSTAPQTGFAPIAMATDGRLYTQYKGR